MSSSLISIYLINSNAFIFDSNDACLLREKYRICGHLIGSLANTSRQNLYYGCPLLLTKEEVFVLVKHLKIACLYEENRIENDNSLITKAKQEYAKLFQETQLSFKEKFKLDSLSKLNLLRDKIYEGKRKKLLAKIEHANKIDVNNELEQLNLKLNELDNEYKNPSSININNNFECNINNIEIYMQTPLALNNLVTFKIPKDEKLMTIHVDEYKFKIYSYLHLRNYYLTCGAKFGGDFLVYKGDPLIYHSLFILKCLPSKAEFSKLTIKDIITYGRLATNVKKSYLIAYIDNNHQNDNVIFTCISWSHI